MHSAVKNLNVRSESQFNLYFQICRPSPAKSVFNLFYRRIRIFEDGFDVDDAVNCPFRCGNGNCRAIEVLCSGKDGCGDNSDESDCHICRECKLL